MRSGLLLTCCLLLAALGCSDERSARIEAQQRHIRQLRRQNDSLRRRVGALADSLRLLSRRIRELEGAPRGRQKLRALLLDNRVGIWEPDEQAMHIRFSDSVDAQNVRDLVDAFNARFAGSFNPELRLLSVENAVARVGVSDDDQLTERMGTAGSRMYLATMTYTLTSLPRIDSVYLDIDEGSHARPGYYSRETWVDLVREE